MKIIIEYESEIFQESMKGTVSIRVKKTEKSEGNKIDYIFPEYTTETIIDAIMHDFSRILKEQLCSEKLNG